VIMAYLVNISQLFVKFQRMDSIYKFLVDSATTHTIIKHKQYFSNMRMMKVKVNTILGSADMIEGSRRANIMLPNGIKFIIDNALFYTKSRRNILSLKNIRLNGYRIEIANENSIEYLYIVSNISTEKQKLKNLHALSSGLYHTSTSTIKVNAIMNQKFNKPNNFIIWHDQLDHLGSIMM